MVSEAVIEPVSSIDVGSVSASTMGWVVDSDGAVFAV